MMKKQNLINGIEVSVKGDSTTTVVFTVKVTEIKGKIKNSALIGDSETPTEPDELDTIDYEIHKTSKLTDKDGLEEEEGYGINLDNTYPIEDEEGKALSDGPEQRLL